MQLRNHDHSGTPSHDMIIRVLLASPHACPLVLPIFDFPACALCTIDSLFSSQILGLGSQAICSLSQISIVMTCLRGGACRAASWSVEGISCRPKILPDSLHFLVSNSFPNSYLIIYNKTLKFKLNDRFK